MSEQRNISTTREKKGGEIWVLGETASGELLSASLELSQEGLKLSRKLGRKLCGVLIEDEGIEQAVDLMASYGVSKIYLLRDRRLINYNCELFTDAFSWLIEYYTPQIVICPATPNIIDFIPRVAVRLQAAFIPNCTILDTRGDGILLCTRPVYAGKFSTTVSVITEQTKIVTIRPGIIELEKPSKFEKAELVKTRVDIKSKAKTQRVGFIKGDPKTLNLPEAEIIVAGGRGVKNKDGWKLIEALAEALEASVGGSRFAYDEKWIGFERQIGQTGKTVRPKLYIACGISGSIYHTAGITDSERIIAINTDPDAEILKVADVGVIGDLHEVIPAMIRKISSASVFDGTP